MQEVIKLLLEAGYVPDGLTHGQTFRIITAKSYPLAGAEIKTGGRQRFILPETNKRVTIGKRITCFYTSENGSASNFQNFKTKDIEGIKEFLDGK